MINKVVAAGLTIAFMAIIRPNPAPSMAASAFVSLLVFVALEYSIEYIREMKRKSDKYTTLILRDRAKTEMHKVANERFRGTV